MTVLWLNQLKVISKRLALNLIKISSTIGVVKGSTTRVGNGPFPWKNLDKVGTRIQ